MNSLLKLESDLTKAMDGWMIAYRRHQGRRQVKEKNKMPLFFACGAHLCGCGCVGGWRETTLGIRTHRHTHRVWKTTKALRSLRRRRRNNSQQHIPFPSESGTGPLFPHSSNSSRKSPRKTAEREKRPKNIPRDK